MIGYYIHHVGRGHLSRACAIAREIDEPVVGLSSLARPDEWEGEWIQLARDDAPDGELDLASADPTAGGVLHWVPRGHAGLASRMAALSEWFSRARPRVMVTDVSVEVTLLARLHGLPVVSFVLPGDRTDPAHQLGFAVSDALLAAWPESADAWSVTEDAVLARAASGHLAPFPPAKRAHERTELRMAKGLDAHLGKLVRVGAISRYTPQPRRTGHDRGSKHVVVLNGRGDDGFDPALLAHARRETPAWRWTVLGGRDGSWISDPWPLLCDATVILTHAGQNAIAETAAARRPALVVPRSRPHEEQHHTAAVLADGRWPVIVRQEVHDLDWSRLLDQAARLDGNAWSAWNDGFGPLVAAAVITSAGAGRE